MYDAVERIGGYRQEFQVAQVNATIMNLAQSIYGKKGRKLTCSPEDFMPYGKWGDEVKESTSDKQAQSTDEMKSILFAMAKQANRKGPPKSVQRRKRVPKIKPKEAPEGSK